MKGFKPKMMG